MGSATRGSTRLTREAYLQHLDSDVRALVASAAFDFEARVPGCPDWNVRDLLSHVIGVYRHKIAAIQTGAEPADPSTGDWGTIAEDEDPRDVLLEVFGELRALLTAPDVSPAWSWWPPEQTVGFWQRRMALETAVHRWDAESAAGAGGAIDGALAEDGIDELLGWLTWDWRDIPQSEADGQSVVVESPRHAWRIVLNRMLVTVDLYDKSTVGDARVTGDASDLFLFLWGRPVTGPVDESGDAVALRLMHERLSMATS